MCWLAAATLDATATPDGPGCVVVAAAAAVAIEEACPDELKGEVEALGGFDAVAELIKKNFTTYSAEEGDSLAAIAEGLNVCISVLQALNPGVEDPEAPLAAGTAVLTPTEVALQEGEVPAGKTEGGEDGMGCGSGCGWNGPSSKWGWNNGGWAKCY
jgi:hypothetical protein